MLRRPAAAALLTALSAVVAFSQAAEAARPEPASSREREREAARLAALLERAPEAVHRGPLHERLAEIRARLGDHTQAMVQLEAAAQAYAATMERAAELRVVLRLAEIVVRHGPRPRRAHEIYLRAALLARMLGDRRAARAVERGLADAAVPTTAAMDLAGLFRGSIDRFPFREALFAVGGDLFPAPGGLLYLRRAGLARFDGTLLERIPLPTDAALRGAATLPDGRVVVGTLRGVYLGDSQGWSRIPVEGANGVLAGDGRGGLWLGARGAALRYLPERGVVERVPLRAPGGDSLEVEALAVTAGGRLLMASSAGVEVRQGAAGAWLRAGQDIPRAVRRMVEEPGGSVWLLSDFGAVRLKEGEARESFSPESLTGNPSVRSLWRASNGTLWLGLGRGVARVDGEDVGVLKEAGDLTEQVWGMIEWPADASPGERSLWFLNQVGGLTRLREPKWRVFDRRLLPSAWVMRLQTRPEGRLLLGTGEGMVELDPRTLATIHHDDSAHCRGVIVALLPLEEGAWMAASQEEKCVALRRPEETLTFTASSGLPEGRPRALARYQGRACLGMTTGVWCLDPATRRWQVPAELSFAQGKPVLRFGLLAAPDGALLLSVEGRGGVFRVTPGEGPGTPTRLVDPALSRDVFLMDTGREILLGGPGGTRRYEAGALREISGIAPETYAYVARRLRDGTLLLSVWNKGVLVSDGEDWILLTVHDGLPSNAVWDIAEDDSAVWFGTGGGGLARLRWDRGSEPEAMIVSHDHAYFVDRAGRPRRLGVVSLRSPGAAEPLGGTASAPEEESWLESTAGIFSIPRAQALPLYTPLDGKEPSLLARLAESGSVDPVPYRGDRVELRLIGVSPKRALAPEEHLYRYRLNGGPWRPQRHDTTLVLRDLPSGEHRLEVVAKGHLLAADPTPAVLRFFVERPLPAWVFVAVAALLAAGLAWQRRRLRWLYLRLRTWRYLPIPDTLFEPQGPVTDRAALVGREGLLDLLAERAERARRQGASVILWGDPQGGTTSILKCFTPRDGDQAVYVDLAVAPVVTLEGVLGAIAAAISVTLGERGIALPEIGESLFRTQLAVEPGGPPTPPSPSPAFERLLVDARRALCGGTLVLLLDHAERLTRLRETDEAYGAYLFPQLQALVSRSPGLMLCVALAGDREELLQHYRDLFVISTVEDVEPLGPVETLTLLRRRAKRWLVFSPEVAEVVHLETGGHPRTLELLGRAVARVASEAHRNLVREADVELGAALVQEEPLASYQEIWARLPPKSKLVLSLFADLPGGERLEEIVAVAQERQAPLLEEEVRRVLAELKRGYKLREEGGRLDFAARLFRRWVARHHPFAASAQGWRSFVGPYQVLDTLGAGGMGVVYKARDLSTGRVCAVKVMAAHLAGDRDARRRFFREARLGMQLSHPNLVRILATGEHDGHGYIAMEYLEGETLSQRLAREGPLPWREAVRIASAAADGLGAMHLLGIVHRDVKSDNLMLVDGGRAPKLMDFGLAHSRALSALTQRGNLLGTLPYLAPEQVAGAEASPSWDLYALGVVLFQSLTGVLPFPEREPLALLSAIAHAPAPRPGAAGVEVPAEVEAVVLKLLAKEPEGRFPDAGTLAASLRALLAP